MSGQTYSIQEETLTEIADAIRTQTGTSEAILTTDMAEAISSIQGGSPEAVLYIEQELTEEQKLQARANIGAVSDEKSEIGIFVQADEPTEAVDGDIWLDPNEVGSQVISDVIIAADAADDGNVEIFGQMSAESEEGQCEAHIANFENPHGVTAAQVGARPSTWMPTAAEVGARPSTWMPTAAEVGARPSTWMPTAAEVGARPSTWMPSASDVGAAPAGFGLGGGCVNIQNWNNAVNNGFYLGNVNTIDGSWWQGFVVKNSDTYISQRAYRPSNNGVLEAHREKTEAGWQEWEWVNPPMAVNTPYRTTERFRGTKAVYTAIIDCGNWSAGKQVTLNVGVGPYPIGWRGYAGAYALPFINVQSLSDASTSYVKVDRTGTNLRVTLQGGSGHTQYTYVQVWYVT